MKLIGEEIVCPLCRNHKVTIQENKKGKPYIFCSDLTIPLNFSTTEAVNFLFQSVKKMQAENQSEEPEREEEKDVLEELGLV